MASPRDRLTRSGRAAAAQACERPTELLDAIDAGRIVLDGDCEAESGPGRWRGKALELTDVIADELSHGALGSADERQRRI
jgi:hypothetical protein